MRVHVEELSRRFGRASIVGPLSFTGLPGEILAVIGNNGAGKTTLLQLLAGLLAPSTGTITFDGNPLDRRSSAQRRSIAFVPDFPPCFTDQTVLQHLAMICTLHDLQPTGLEEQVLSLMNEIGILALGDSTMGLLSRGELYKVILVGHLLARPTLWLLDEPLASGMDPQGLAFLRKHLRGECEAGATVLYSTQIAEAAETFSDRVFVLQEGELVAQENASRLCHRLGVSSLAEALARLTSQ